MIFGKRKIWKEEQGAMPIMEAAFVFPIMFFVLLFLIYMGNMYFMRSRVDAIVAESAVKGAAYCADPYYKILVDNNGTAPNEITDIQPYHALLGTTAMAQPIRNSMTKALNGLGTGFFAGMGTRSVSINKFEYKKGLIGSTFTVDVTYSIKFPIRFLGENSPTILRFDSRTVAPVTDTGEFIQNVDMAMDFFDTTTLPEKLNKMVQKVKDFLK